MRAREKGRWRSAPPPASGGRLVRGAATRARHGKGDPARSASRRPAKGDHHKTASPRAGEGGRVGAGPGASRNRAMAIASAHPTRQSPHSASLRGGHGNTRFRRRQGTTRDARPAGNQIYRKDQAAKGAGREEPSPVSKGEHEIAGRLGREGQPRRGREGRGGRVTNQSFPHRSRGPSRAPGRTPYLSGCISRSSRAIPATPPRGPAVDPHQLAQKSSSRPVRPRRGTATCVLVPALLPRVAAVPSRASDGCSERQRTHPRKSARADLDWRFALVRKLLQGQRHESCRWVYRCGIFT